MAAPRAVLAVIGISSDLVVDLEGTLLVTQFPGVLVRHTKMAMTSEEICAATYEASFAAGNVQQAVDSLKWPLGFNSIWGIACTSLSFTLGPERVSSLFNGEKHTDMMSAVMVALETLKADEETPRTRVSVLTPYIDAVHNDNVAQLRAAGVDVVTSMNLGFTVDAMTSAASRDYITECADALLGDGGHTDVVFIGCSAFRAMAPGYITELERHLSDRTQRSVAVVTSMQAFFWHMLRSAGIDDRIDDYGVLFRTH